MTTPTPLTDAELDAIHGRVQAVADACGTAGWFAYERDGDVHVEAEPDGPHIALVGQASWDGVAEQAAFIALARTDVPRLLETIQHLTDALAASERRIETQKNSADSLVETLRRRIAAVEAQWDEASAEADRLREVRDAAIAQTAALKQYVVGLQKEPSDLDHHDFGQPADKAQHDAAVAYAARRAVAVELARLLNGARP